jgi:hypothetical protein
MKSLGKRRKRFALLLIAAGLCSFFVPLVRINPSVLGRSQWSALNIASEIHKHNLPVAGGDIDINLIFLALVYALMAAALVILCFSSSATALKIISGMGVVLSFSRYWHSSFESTLFGFHMRGSSIKYGPAMYVFPWVMLGLLIICFTEGLDSELVEPETKQATTTP